MIKQIKNIMENLPYPVGRALSLLPFRYRLGTAYSQFHLRFAPKTGQLDLV